MIYYVIAWGQRLVTSSEIAITGQVYIILTVAIHFENILQQSKTSGTSMNWLISAAIFATVLVASVQATPGK